MRTESEFRPLRTLRRRRQLSASQEFDDTLRRRRRSRIITLDILTLFEEATNFGHFIIGIKRVKSTSVFST